MAPFLCAGGHPMDFTSISLLLSMHQSLNECAFAIWAAHLVTCAPKDTDVDVQHAAQMSNRLTDCLRAANLATTQAADGLKNIPLRQTPHFYLQWLQTVEVYARSFKDSFE